MTDSLLTRFIEQNPADKRTAQILRAMNRPLSINSRIGYVIGHVMREQAEKEARA